MTTDEWVAQAQAALLEDEPIPFKVACLPEYRRRLLGVYAACAGWPRERTAGLHPFVEAASRAFEAECPEPWLLALAELERRVGITAGAGSD